MCPLRFILIFLSATLAGFFLVRNLKSFSPADADAGADTCSGDDVNKKDTANDASFNATPCNLFSQVSAGAKSGFWMFVDMASGKYLWRHLVSSSPSSDKKSKKLE